MRCRVTILYALLFGCTVCSCSKKSTPNDPEPPHEGSVVTRSKTTINNREIKYRIYDRDANNRITAIRDSSDTHFQKTDLVYGSNGKLEKAFFYFVDSLPAYSFEFGYNDAGRISKRKKVAGTLNIPAGYNSYKYDAAGHLTADSFYSTTPNGTSLGTISTFKYTGDNATEAEFYAGQNWTTPNDKRKYEYDNGINPLASLEYEYYLTELQNGIDVILKKCGNNMAKSYFQSTIFDPVTLQQKITCKYNSGNIAWKATITNVTQFNTVDVNEYFFQ